MGLTLSFFLALLIGIVIGWYANSIWRMFAYGVAATGFKGPRSAKASAGITFDGSPSILVTYQGEPDFDFSCAIENNDNGAEFLGEIGFAPSDDSKTAFDVWLFDKPDVRTVTYVLVKDKADAEKFQYKGIVLPIEPEHEQEFDIAATYLSAHVRIVEVVIRDGKFEKLTVEFSHAALKS